MIIEKRKKENQSKIVISPIMQPPPQPFLLLFHYVKVYISLACYIVSTPNCSAQVMQLQTSTKGLYLVQKWLGLHLVKAVDVTQTEISPAWTRIRLSSPLFAQGNLYHLRKEFPLTVGVIILGSRLTTKLKASSLDRPHLQSAEARSHPILEGSKLQKGPSLCRGMLQLVTASPHY